jgi:hypothetical protein
MLRNTPKGEDLVYTAAEAEISRAVSCFDIGQVSLLLSQ